MQGCRESHRVSGLCRAGPGLPGCRILAGRHPFGALEYPGKVELIEKAHRNGHLSNGQAAGPQQLAGLVDPVFGEVVDGAFAHVAHKDAIEVAAGNPYTPGHIVDGNIVGIVELDVFDGVQHILAGGVGTVGPLLVGLLHQVSQEKIEISHHGRLILHAHPAGAENVVHGFVQRVRMQGMVDRLLIRKGEHGRQLVGADPVEPHPAVFPGLLGIRRISGQLVGPDKKEVARVELPAGATGLQRSLAGQNQVDQIMVPDAGAPGMAGRAALQTTVEDGKIYIVGVVLLE